MVGETRMDCTEKVGGSSMKIFGYERVEIIDGDDEFDEGSLELKEITLMVNPHTLRTIAQFFLKTAELMDEHGQTFGHEHYQDFIDKEFYDGTDIIILPERV